MNTTASRLVFAGRRAGPTWLVGLLCLFVRLAETPAAERMPADYPPIRWAILDRDVGEVRRLVEAGADKEQPLHNSETPALMAAKVDSWDIVLYLLRNGANPAAPDDFGDTIAPIARTSRVHPDAPEYRDLEAVRSILRERGLY